MNYELKPIAESNNFIVLDKYTKIEQIGGGYQTESDLEKELIQDLCSQGYEFMPDIKNSASMLANVRVQLQSLNSVQFSNGEWSRFVEDFCGSPRKLDNLNRYKGLLN